MIYPFINKVNWTIFFSYKKKNKKEQTLFFTFKLEYIPPTAVQNVLLKTNGPLQIQLGLTSS